MNRRTFLLSAAVAASSAGGAVPPRPKKPIRCALLGIDHSHALDVLGVLQNLPDYEVVGVCEPDPEVQTQFAAAAALDKVAWIELGDLLNDGSIEMIAVESAVPRLLELGRVAVAAGKHLHLDKPAGADLAAWRALLDEAQRRRLIVQMGYMFRYNPGFDLVRRAVREGWLGSIYAIGASMCTQLTPEKRRPKAFHPGGMMLELGCHLIDMIVLLLGAPRKVTSFLRHDSDIPDGLADNCCAVLEYDRAMAVVETAAMEPSAFPTRRFKIAGTKGKIVLEPLEPAAIRIFLDAPAGGFDAGEHTPALEDLPRHRADFIDLARCIRGEAEFAYSSTHDFEVQRTVLRACGIET